MKIINLAPRIQRGELAIAAAKAQGRDVTHWEQHLERLKREAFVQELSPLSSVTEEIRDTADNLRAVMIRSTFVKDDLWLIFDRTFDPRDNRAVYYPEELRELRTKTQQQLCEIHNLKLIFPGCRIIQEGAQI
jgi:hypothetical protein